MNRRPSLFILGAPKSGTSALAAYLDQHPSVFFCKPKEPFYWSFDYPGLKRRMNLDSLDDYLELFAEAGNQHRVLGEGSTNYLRSNCAIEKIMDFNPAARMVVMLRNPIEVAHAYHSELLFSYWEDEPDFEKAWRKQDQRALRRQLPKGCPAPQLLQYREIAAYTEQVQRFFELVPENQRHVIIFDDFKDFTRSVFDETVDFLKLPHHEMKSFERVNAAHQHRYEWVSKLVLDPPPAVKPMVESLRKFCRKFQGGLITKAKMALRKPTKRKPLSPEFRAELADYFHADVEKLSGVLNRDLMHWVTGKSPNEFEKVEAKLEPVLAESGGKK